jgi:hypothetical protein
MCLYAFCIPQAVNNTLHLAPSMSFCTLFWNISCPSLIAFCVLYPKRWQWDTYVDFWFGLLFHFCSISATSINVHPSYSPYGKLHYMFQLIGHPQMYKLLCSRELLFCFSAVIVLSCLCWQHAVAMFGIKYAVFWDVAPCEFIINWRFRGTCHLHLQGRRSEEKC